MTAFLCLETLDSSSALYLGIDLDSKIANNAQKYKKWGIK